MREVGGLPVELDGKTNKLVLGGGLPRVEPEARRLEEMRPVLLDKGIDGPAEVYYMYRDIYLAGDRELILRYGLKYDITVILSGKLGRECIKTLGHYHPYVPGVDLTYPEVYEVLYGEALYLLQKVWDIYAAPEDMVVEDVIAVEAQVGDKVVIPPNYGHITINRGNLTLVMANWVGREFEPLFGPMSATNGGSYFLLADGQWVKNENYKWVPELHKVRAKDLPNFGVPLDKPLYLGFLEVPARFGFLVRPQGLGV